MKVDWRKARFIREGLEPFDGSALVSWAISGRRAAKAPDDEMEGGPREVSGDWAEVAPWWPGLRSGWEGR